MWCAIAKLLQTNIISRTHSHSRKLVFSAFSSSSSFAFHCSTNNQALSSYHSGRVVDKGSENFKQCWWDGDENDLGLSKITNEKVFLEIMETVKDLLRKAVSDCIGRFRPIGSILFRSVLS
jgi:hypothetical protein